MAPEFVRIEDYRPFWEAFRQHEEWTAFTGEINGQGAWSDGHVLMLGIPPPSGEKPTDKPRGFEGPLKQAERETLKPITALAVAEMGEYKTVVFSDGHIVNVRYWRLLNERWPHAIWLGDKLSRVTDGMPVVIRDGGKLVAVVMAIRPHAFEVEIQEILTSLQSANVCESQATSQSREEHQPKK